MKKLFYTGLLGLLLFEIANVYFIMPMPGSQRMNSIGLAYFLYSWRWAFRVLFAALLLTGLIKGNWKRRWTAIIPMVIIGVGIWFLNFRMSADHMFHQPSVLLFADAAHNKIDSNRLVIGVAMNGQAKAYPIQFMGYHHIVQDTVGDTPVVVTYCTVCRTGRVYDPHINGKVETFRLVGMDHFNAMMEDATTKSWWRQATGEAVAGSMKNAKMRDIFCTQTTLAEWLRMHPSSLVMQRDPALRGGNPKRSLMYENGENKEELTGTDPASWHEKSWVLGVDMDGITRAYDWNELKAKRVITDKVGTHYIALVMDKDNTSFYGMEVPKDGVVTLSADTLLYNGHRYTPEGKGIDTSTALTSIAVRQEFWHSWQTFHPGTTQYK